MKINAFEKKSQENEDFFSSFTFKYFNRLEKKQRTIELFYTLNEIDYFAPPPELRKIIETEKYISFYLFQEIDGHFYSKYIWFDLDREEEEVKRIFDKCMKNRILPNYVVETGRHYAFIYEFPYWLEKNELLPYFYFLSAFVPHDHPSKMNEKNAMIRPPSALNEKNEKNVNWIKIEGDKYNEFLWVPDPEFTLKSPPTHPPLFENEERILKTKKKFKPNEVIDKYVSNWKSKVACKLFHFLDQEEMWRQHNYNAWRFLSYFYARNDDKTFLLKSEIWEGENKEQSPSYRFNRSKEELERGTDAFWICSNLSKMDKYELFKINENPCQNCVFSSVRKKAWEIDLSFTFDFSKYNRKGNSIFTNSTKIIEEFNPIAIFKEAWENYVEIFIIFEHEGKYWKFSIDDAQLFHFLSAPTREAKEYIQRFIAQNANLVNTIDKYTGIWNFKTNFKNKEYLYTRINEYADCEVSPNLTKDEIPDLIKLIRKFIESDIYSALCLGFSLLPVLTNSHEWERVNNPVLLLIGHTGVGKTLRAQIANALWRRPHHVFDFLSLTPAFIQKFLSFVKALLVFDEVSFLRSDERKDLLYSLANRARKTTSTYSSPAFTSPLILTSELSKFKNIEELGLQRRIIQIYIPSISLQSLISFHSIMKERYGLIAYLIDDKVLERRREIFEKIKILQISEEDLTNYILIHILSLMSAFSFIDEGDIKDYALKFINLIEETYAELQVDNTYYIKLSAIVDAIVKHFSSSEALEFSLEPFLLNYDYLTRKIARLVLGTEIIEYDYVRGKKIIERLSQDGKSSKVEETIVARKNKTVYRSKISILHPLIRFIMGKYEIEEIYNAFLMWLSTIRNKTEKEDDKIKSIINSILINLEADYLTKIFSAKNAKEKEKIVN